MVALLTGVLGLIQQIIILYSPNPNPIWQEKVFSSAIWLGFLVSAFALWLLEYQKTYKLTIELTDERERNRPKIVGEIHEVLTTLFAEDVPKIRTKKVKRMLVVLRVSLTNESMIPTMIANFSLEVRTSSGTCVGMPFSGTLETQLGVNARMMGPDIGENLFDDFRKKKTVKPFRLYPGYVMFQVKDLNEMLKEGTTYVVTIIDPVGGTHPLVPKTIPRSGLSGEGTALFSQVM